MHLTKLLEGLDYTACGVLLEQDITEPATDSRNVQQGGIFKIGRAHV